jgi:hypothetical protein
MKIVNILTEGFISFNGRAFLQPIVFNNNRIKDYSIKVMIHKKISSNIVNCDLLIIDSKFFRSWWLKNKEEMLELVSKFNDSTNVVFFDTTDSAGYMLGDILPYVKSYYKHQILVSKKDYLCSMYGRRSFTEYYHRNNNVIDDDKAEENFIQIKHEDYLKKIKVSWNTGLANYSFLGEYLGRIYSKYPINRILRYPINFTSPQEKRLIEVQCRFGTFYNKESVAYQRKAIATILKDKVQTKKINRYNFYKELKLSKVVMSPFGLGEITLKDFEVFISGGILMKPDMSHLDTWPNFYNKETYVPFKWDLTDISEKLELVLENYSEYIEIAINAQNLYHHYVSTNKGYDEFALRFQNIVNEEIS